MMSKPQKILTIVLWIIAVGAMVGVVAIKTIPQNPGNSSSAMATSAMIAESAPTTQPAVARVWEDPAEHSEGALPVFYAAPAFSLTDQDGKSATNTQFLGHPWIADFIFTTCGTLCPLMSAHMQELQRKLPADVLLVSFSVDPKHDTPPVLKDYATTFRAQNGRWFFLTGDEQTQDNVIREMKVVLVPAHGAAQITHDEHFLLVDAMGNVRGVYDSLVPAEMNKLAQDAQALLPRTNGIGQ
jgi:protein SCO1